MDVLLSVSNCNLINLFIDGFHDKFLVVCGLLDRRLVDKRLFGRHHGGNWHHDLVGTVFLGH